MTYSIPIILWWSSGIWFDVPFFFFFFFFWDSCYFFWFGCLRNICLYQPCFQRRGKKSWWRRRFFKEDVPWRRRQEGMLPPESRIYDRQSPTDRWPCIHIPVAQSQKKLSKTWWFFFKNMVTASNIYIYIKLASFIQPNLCVLCDGNILLGFLRIPLDTNESQGFCWILT